MPSQWRTKLTQFILITNLQILLASSCGISMPLSTGATNIQSIKPMADESFTKLKYDIRYDLPFNQQDNKNFLGLDLPHEEFLIPRIENNFDRTHMFDQEKHWLVPKDCYQPLSNMANPKPITCPESNNLKESKPSQQSSTGFKMPLKVYNTTHFYATFYPTTESLKQNKFPIDSCENIRSRLPLPQLASILLPPCPCPTLQHNSMNPLALDLTEPVIPSKTSFPPLPVPKFDVNLLLKLKQESLELLLPPLSKPAYKTILPTKDFKPSVSPELPLPIYNRYNSGYPYVSSPYTLPKPYIPKPECPTNKPTNSVPILSVCPNQYITTCVHYSYPHIFNAELKNCPKVPTINNSSFFLSQCSSGFVNNLNMLRDRSHNSMYSNFNTLRPVSEPAALLPSCCNISPLSIKCLPPGSLSEIAIENPFRQSIFEPSLSLSSVIENCLLPTTSHCSNSDSMCSLSSVPSTCFFSSFSPANLPNHPSNSLYEEDISNFILKSDLKAVKRSPDIQRCKDIFPVQTSQKEICKKAINEPKTTLSDSSDKSQTILELIKRAEMLNDNNECDWYDIDEILSLLTDL